MPISTSITSLVRGKLSELPVVEILGYAYAKRLTGRLRLVRENNEKTILFLNGLPVGAGSDPAGPGLIEILSEVQRLSSDDLLQLQSLQKEKGATDEDLIRMFGLATDAEIYDLHLEDCTRTVLEACGWREGRYAFRTGEELVEGKPLFDLNPLELIYHGIRAHHQQDLPELIQQMQGKFARLNHGWESTLALPGEYYRHSDLLDHFENPANIGDAIPRLYSELGDLNNALLFLYLLLVTGILEVCGDDSIHLARAPKPAPALTENVRPPGPVRFEDEPDGRGGREGAEVRAAEKVTAAAAAEAPAAAPGTSYIITGKRRKGRKRAEEEPASAAVAAPVATAPAPMVPAPEPELPPIIAARVAPAAGPIPIMPPAPAAGPPGISDDDWLFGESGGAETEAPRAGLGLPEYFSPPAMPTHLLGPEEAEPAAPARVASTAPGWGAEPEGSYGPIPGGSSRYGSGPDEDDDAMPESELMVLPDTEYPYFEEETEERPRPEPKGVERKKLASVLRKTKAAYEELGGRLRGDYDHYERLGVEMDADVAEIQSAYDGILDRLALDHLPPEAQDEFAERLAELSEVAHESFKILTDPNERIAIEQAIYNKRKQRSRTTEQKQRLAGQQWRRGKWYLENSSRADLARRCFQEALELDPRPQYYAYVGWALYRNNRSEYELLEARSYLKQALDHNSHYGEAHYFLGLIAKREGELEAARNHFQEAVRLNPDDRLALRELELFQRSTRPQGILGRMFLRRG